MNDASTETSVEEKPQRVEARAAKDPAVRTFIFAAMLLGFGIWFFLDGHVHNKYPHKPFSESINAWFKWALNYFGPFVLIPAGLLVLVCGVLFLRRVLVADQDGIGYVKKGKIAWEQITNVDASRLQSKGILHLHCSEGKKLKLDSWKLQNFRDLIAFVENQIPPDRISK